MTFGNHKGATSQPAMLKKILSDEVTRGWQIPIPKKDLLELPGCVMAPLNITRQDTINKFGEIVPKDRLTHNQSMKWTYSNSSINSRVQDEKFPPCVYGHSLTRVFHHIVALRIKYPTKRIFMAKYDWKSAYRRCQTDISFMLQQVTSYDDDIALIGCRFSFGGKPWPAQWSVISESTTDLVNDILSCDKWNRESLKSPYQHLVPKQKEPSKSKLLPGLKLRIPITPEPRGKADVYIDDIFVSVADIGPNVGRASHATPLAIHVMGRPLDPADPLPRDNLLSEPKLAAEGAMCEELLI